MPTDKKEEQTENLLSENKNTPNVQKMGEKEQSQKYLAGVANNISVGAQLFRKKTERMAKNIIDKVNINTQDLLDKLKNNATGIYNTGENLADSLKVKADEYIERYKDKQEFKILHEKLKEKYIELGKLISNKYLNKRKKIQIIYSDKDVKDLIADIEILEKEVVNFGEKEQNNTISQMEAK